MNLTLYAYLCIVIELARRYKRQKEEAATFESNLAILDNSVKKIATDNDSLRIRFEGLRDRQAELFQRMLGIMKQIQVRRLSKTPLHKTGEIR